MVLYEQDRFGNILPVGIFSRLTFRWINKTLKHGNRSRIQEKDIPELRNKDSADLLVQVLEKNWHDEKHLSGLSPDRKWPLLTRVLVKSFSFHLSVLFVLMLFDLLLRVLIVALVGALVGQLQSPSTRAYIYAGLLGGASLLYALLRNLFVYSLEERGIQIQTSVIGLIYRKVQRLNQKSFYDVTSCHLTRLVSIECQKIQTTSFFITHLAVFPLEVIIITVLSWQHINWLSLIATCFVLALIPLQMAMGRYCSKLRYELTRLSKKRMSLMERIIKGIRIVKMNVWESPLSSLVNDIRRNEVKFLRRNILMLSFQQMIQFCCLTMISFIVFPTMIFLDKPLTAEKVFSTLALYSCLFHSALFVSRGIVRIPEALVAMQQIEQFMEMDELRPKDTILCHVVGNSMFFVNAGFDRLQENSKTTLPTTVLSFDQLTNQSQATDTKRNEDKETPRVSFKNACFNWSMKKQTPALSDISLDLDDKSLLCVTGLSDTGKTALLLATLEEVPLVDGQFAKTGRTVYVPQVPWVFTGTLRDNILFNSPYAEDRYWRVIYVCALDKDIGEFPNGDLTLLEKGGVALTTDQRVRVSLARAAYCEADVYLFDDCLSLLDDRTREQLVKRLITGLLSNTCRVVVSSNHDIMEHCSHIVVMDNGRIKQQGSYQHIKHLLDTAGTTENAQHNRESDNKQEIHEHSRRTSTSSSDVIFDDSMAKIDDDLPVGVSNWSVCWKYLRSGRSVMIITLLALIMVTSQGMVIITDWWLAEWSNMNPQMQANKNIAYVFYACAVVAVVLALVRSVGCFFTLLNTSKNLHNTMVTAVLKAQVSFFDSNPLERILHRFSKDTHNMDNLLPYGISESIHTVIYVTSVIIVCSVFNYWMPLVGVPVLVLSVCLRRYALRSINDLKKLEQSCRHDMLTHCTTTLQGLTCIRAFNTQECFLHKFNRLLDNHTRSCVMFNAGIRWLCLRTELLFGVFLLGISLVAVLSETNAGYAGMSLLYAIQLLADIHWTVIITTETETIMPSFARILSYSTLEPESGYAMQHLSPQDWPQGSGIKCEDLSYDNEPQENLKLTNLDIRPNEKIAVVGQKHSGTSSLITALFRLPQPNGRVFVDGVDISELALQDTRKLFGLVPERPHLLSTSLRFNLDPWKQFSDAALWDVLEQLHLKPKVLDQLDSNLQASIFGFTPTELKLVALGQALLEDKHILIVGEDETNPDWSSKLIQDIIRTHFQERTVFTFAHSLDTIINSDRVLVMRSGCVVEFNTPEDLCRQGDNHLMDILSQLAL